ncbi:MAG: hypothetical protein EOP53_04830 [Sphingobacteriales bacterium]|nr:MAG: hypothetical protein EOP53_04830 [Sphingobacteriales bacterium]
MKPGLLCNEKVQKLKDMTTVLFPHYSINITAQKDIYLYRNDEVSSRTDVQHFHWFEFCLAVLPPKLFGNSYERTLEWYNVIESCKEGISIVDALYTQFQKSCEKEKSITKLAS